MHHDNASTSGWNGRIGPHFSNAIHALPGLPRARDVKPWPGLRSAIGRKRERFEIHALECQKVQFSAMSQERRGNSKTRGAVAVMQVASVAEWAQAQQELQVIRTEDGGMIRRGHLQARSNQRGFGSAEASRTRDGRETTRTLTAKGEAADNQNELPP